MPGNIEWCGHLAEHVVEVGVPEERWRKSEVVGVANCNRLNFGQGVSFLHQQASDLDLPAW